MDDDEARYRLPRSVVPHRYDLVLEPDLEAVTFAGSETVTLEVVEPVDEIVLNAAELDVGPGGSRAPAGRSRSRRSAWTRRPSARTCSCRGRPSRGSGRSTWGSAAGCRTSCTGSTARPTPTTRASRTRSRPRSSSPPTPGARSRAGTSPTSRPCSASRWWWTTGCSRSRTGPRSAANRPATAASGCGSPTRWRCRRTSSRSWSGRSRRPSPSTSTACRSGSCTGRGRPDLAAFAAEVGAFSLRFFADYYGIPYPDAKMDIVALPDFAQGAMENLGCVTYRESLLLVDPDKATQPELAHVADVIAHELAHMWFGDLVTMRWWNGIWLNEAFATLMELLAVDAYRPDWERWSQFLRSRAIAFEVDALASTRSIEYPVRSPDDASGMFDILTYTKGAAVLRMLEQYLGAERFRDGIRRYLDEHRFGNTETHDLWDAIEKATDEPVRRIMDGWIWQGGYPLVSARLRNGEGRARAAALPDLGRGGRHGLGRAAARADVRGDRTRADRAGRRLDRGPDDGPVVVNAGVHAFVRVEYDDELLGRLTADLRSLSTDERTQLVDDTWAAVVAGRRSAVDFCRFAASFADETELAGVAGAAAGARVVRALPDGRAARALPVVDPGAAVAGDRTDRMGAARGRARPGQASAWRVDGGARRPRRRPPGLRPRDGDRARVARRRAGRPVARRGLGRDRRGRRHGRGLRAVRRGDGVGADAAGGAPLPVRAPGLPGRGARSSGPWRGR